jgi:hypothetical protein
LVCTPPSEAFISQFLGKTCDVVLRINADVSSILGYRVVCGNYDPLTQAEAKAQLAPISRINWQLASAYSSPSQGQLFVHENPYDVIAFGPITGQILFEFYVYGTTDTVVGEFSPGSELNGNCPGQSTTQILGWAEAFESELTQKVSQLLHSHGVFYGISFANSGYDDALLVNAALTTPEYFVVLSAVPHA